MQKNPHSDITSKGLAAGLLIPFLLMLAILSISSQKFDSFTATIQHYQNFNLLYKTLSICLMPGAGLFFHWSKTGKINQARGTLFATLAYGLLVLYLYFT